jgi:hypothetical protein
MKFIASLTTTIISIGTAFVFPAIAVSPSLDKAVVDLRGIGAVRVGMSVRQAERVIGRKLQLNLDSKSGSTCGYASVAKQAGIYFMTTDRNISRIDIRNPKVKTVSGAKVGDSEQRIARLYGTRLKVSPHKYTKGHYLTVIPQDAGDRNYRLIFETDGKKVTAYRVGKLPEVEYVEGCS